MRLLFGGIIYFPMRSPLKPNFLAPLLLLTPNALSWTLNINHTLCTQGQIAGSDTGDDVFVRDLATTSCTSGLLINACPATPAFINTGGPFIPEPTNPNVSIEIEFTVPHPIPNTTALFAAYPPLASDGFEVDRAAPYAFALLMINNYVPPSPDLLEGWIAAHFFALYLPASFTRTGFCDVLSGTTQLLLFTDTVFSDIMLAMRQDTARTNTYNVRAMFITLPDDTLTLLYVRLRLGLTEGWAFSPTNIALSNAAFIEYAPGTPSKIPYVLGCLPQVNASSGLSIKSVSISQTVVLPPPPPP